MQGLGLKGEARTQNKAKVGGENESVKAVWIVNQGHHVKRQEPGAWGRATGTGTVTGTGTGEADSQSRGRRAESGGQPAKGIGGGDGGGGGGGGRKRR